MPRKLFITLLVTAVFATVALLGYGQIWAKPPCEELRIFDNKIKVQFKPGCEEVLDVWFWENGDWRLAQKTTAVMCTCEGADCVDDLQANINNPNVTVECYPVRDTGPLSGCPVYLNPDRYFFGGSYYR
jgi:hypothetical protein